MKVFKTRTIPASHRINIDQVPLGVDRQSPKSYVHESISKTVGVQISSTDSGADKRFCTLQIMASPEKTNCILSMFFRGTCNNRI